MVLLLDVINFKNLLKHELTTRNLAFRDNTKSSLIVIAIAPSLLEIQQRYFVVAIILPTTMTFFVTNSDYCRYK
jgi:hypothetical protein